jgi:hypothetical protein
MPGPPNKQLSKTIDGKRSQGQDLETLYPVCDSICGTRQLLSRTLDPCTAKLRPPLVNERQQGPSLVFLSGLGLASKTNTCSEQLTTLYATRVPAACNPMTAQDLAYGPSRHEPLCGGHWSLRARLSEKSKQPLGVKIANTAHPTPSIQCRLQALVV